MATFISNIKVTSNDVIKNWWKLNYFTGRTFKDTAEGDVDFYTYWYSICQMVGMVNVFRRIFRDVTLTEKVLRRFLQSRDIAFTNSATLGELVYIYNNWVEYINKRGTVAITEKRGDSNEVGVSEFQIISVIEDDLGYNAGIGVLSNEIDLVGEIGVSQLLGVWHTIQFDMLLVDDSGVQYEVGGENLGGVLLDTSNAYGIYLLKNGVADSQNMASYSFTYRCNGVNHSFTTSVNVSVLNNVKFVRYSGVVLFYINDIYIGRSTVTATDYFLIQKLFTSKLPAIANILVTVRDVDFATVNQYSWKCNEGSGFSIESNVKPSHVAQLAISDTLAWSKVWRRSSLFANTNYIPIDGEVRRITNYTFGESILELISNSELGITIDMSSPLSEEASCVNLNKAYQGGVITDLSKYPLRFNNSVKPWINSGYIEYNLLNYNNRVFGLNPKLLTQPNWTIAGGYKPYGQTPFIPINVASNYDDIDGYEISFVIQSSQNIHLYFGLRTYGSGLNHLADQTKSYVTDSASDMFLNLDDFSGCKNRDLWVRGVYSMNKLGAVANTLNIGRGNNLYSITQDSVKFIAPIIGFIASDYYMVTVKIKDIVVRPLSLNTSKGMVRNKNTMIGFIKNDSGKSDSDVTKFIDNKLIPYNCVTNIKYL